LSSTNLFRARIGSCALAAVLLGSTFAAAAQASDMRSSGPQLWFQGSRVILGDSQPQADDIAVSSTDAGLIRFLARVGARIDFQAGQQYAIVTSADRRQITFTVGDSNIRVDGVVQSGPFAVIMHGKGVYLPFYALARALDLAAVTDNGQVVLEPQITSLDAHEDHGRSVVILHSAIPLHPEVVDANNERVTIRFRGVGTTLQSREAIETPGLRYIGITQTGTPRSPITSIRFSVTDQARAGLLRSFDPHGAVLAFAPPSIQLHAPVIAANIPVTNTVDTPPPYVPVQAPVAVATLAPVVAQSTSLPQPQSVVSPSSDTVAITAIDEKPSADTYSVRLAMNGQPNYRWRILGDGRFFIDFPGTHLTIPIKDETLQDQHVSALRMRDNGTPDAPNVRLAMNLVGNSAAHITSDTSSLTITIEQAQTTMLARAGAGHVGVAEQTVTTSTAGMPSQVAPGSAMFPAGPPTRVAAGMGSRLIVLDPGHGGSDSGAIGNGLTEKLLTLDIARRLRELLVAHGWQVMMTRDSDVDVYAANDSAREELQARCDVANRAGARLFVSIHINSFTTSELQGTTTYFYKPGDARFASIVDDHLHTLLGTQDDGAKRENFYVVRHTTMPSILVETAFLSNPDDATRLRQPNFRQNVALGISNGIMAYTADSPGMNTSVGTNTSKGTTQQPVDDLAP
jgi:N-acetylmuramoyl-L-alanine amidase CwlD